MLTSALSTPPDRAPDWELGRRPPHSLIRTIAHPANGNRSGPGLANSPGPLPGVCTGRPPKRRIATGPDQPERAKYQACEREDRPRNRSQRHAETPYIVPSHRTDEPSATPDGGADHTPIQSGFCCRAAHVFARQMPSDSSLRAKRQPSTTWMSVWCQINDRTAT
jgi:hypothetical protein